MQAAVTARVELEGALRLGLQRREFLLLYQPQVCANGKLVGAEALVRWQHPQRGLLAPGEFITVAEDSGLVIPLGLQVLEMACEQIVRWSADGGLGQLDEFAVSVNVSARQLRQPDFVDQVLATLSRTGADPHRLKLELTESQLLDNVEETIAKMTALRAHGVGFSLDDFGTGYSSLTYLKRLPLDQLKVDQSFVQSILVDANDAAIAQMVVALGHTMGLKVVAEGVETEEQRAFLAGCGLQRLSGLPVWPPGAGRQPDGLPAHRRVRHGAAAPQAGGHGRRPSPGRAASFTSSSLTSRRTWAWAGSWSLRRCQISRTSSFRSSATTGRTAMPGTPS